MTKNQTKKHKPVLLCILDGWGIGDDNNPDNAIARAKLPIQNINCLRQKTDCG